VFVHSYLAPRKKYVSGPKPALDCGLIGIEKRKVHMIFRVLIVLDPTLCELENYLCGTVKQRKKVDVDVLQDC
jgi:hypothetical protein